MRNFTKKQWAKMHRELIEAEEYYGWKASEWQADFDDCAGNLKSGHFFCEKPFQPLIDDLIKHLNKNGGIKSFKEAWGECIKFSSILEYQSDIDKWLEPYEAYFLDAYPEAQLGPAEILKVDLRIILKNLEDMKAPFKHKKYNLAMQEKIGIEIPTSLKFIMDLEKETICSKKLKSVNLTKQI